MKKIFLYIVIGITLLAIPATVFLVGQQQELRQKAAPASTLYFEPATVTANAGKTFKVNVNINTAENNVNVVQIHVVFDPTLLKARSITNGSLAPRITSAGIVENGSATITVGAKNTTKPIHGTGRVAVLTMEALAGSATPVSIRFASDTYANGVNETKNVLIGTSPVTVTLNDSKGKPVTATEGAATPTEVPTGVVAPHTINFGGTNGNKYKPKDLIVKKGDTVTWTGDFTKYPLASDPKDNLWPTVTSGTSFQHTFNTLGQFIFYANKKGSSPTKGMRGRITVLETDAPLTPIPTLEEVPEGPEATESGTAIGGEGNEASGSGSLVITSPTDNQTLSSSVPTFTGTADPGAVVTLTIHSDPLTVVVTADANGNWSYTPTTPLDSGPHTIVAAATNATSGTTQTVESAFVVEGDGQGGAESSAIPVSGAVENTILLVGIGALLLISGALLPVFVK